MLDSILECVSKNMKVIEEHSFMYSSGDSSAKYTCSVTSIDKNYCLFWYTYIDGVHIKYSKIFRPHFLMKYKICFDTFIKFHKRKFVSELNLADNITKHLRGSAWN